MKRIVYTTRPVYYADLLALMSGWLLIFITSDLFIRVEEAEKKIQEFHKISN